MREYGKVYIAFWSDPSMRELSEDARGLALYLLTCPHGNLIGLFRMPDAYAADDLQWPVERVSKGFAELFRKGFCTREKGSNWLVIAKYLRWNPFENPNVAKSAHKVFESAPDCHAKLLCGKGILEYCGTLPEGFRKGLLKYIETLSDSAAIPEPSLAEPEPQPNQSHSLTVSASASLSRGRPSKLPESKTASVWQSYADAYQRRYGQLPVRNAKINSQLANIVDRLGAEECPHVAEFYVGHGGRWYVQQMHSVEALQRDCEKLRTEWATGSRMTAARADQSDKTQTNADVFGKLIAEAEAAQREN